MKTKFRIVMMAAGCFAATVAGAGAGLNTLEILLTLKLILQQKCDI